MRRPETAEELLAWLDQNAVRLDFQDLSARVLRQKNRVVLSYWGSAGVVAVVGGRDLKQAIIKAVIRRGYTA